MEQQQHFPQPDLDKQQKMMQEFIAVAEANDAEPIDILMAFCRSAFNSLEIVTVPDEKGDKVERMHHIWEGMFEAMAKEQAMREAVEAAAKIDWDEINDDLNKLVNLPKP